ncbi:unnamed protein product, partial [Meganyctiphanes norvegica]
MSKSVSILKMLKFTFPSNILKSLYHFLIYPYYTYCNLIHKNIIFLYCIWNILVDTYKSCYESNEALRLPGTLLEDINITATRIQNISNKALNDWCRIFSGFQIDTTLIIFYSFFDLFQGHSIYCFEEKINAFRASYNPVRCFPITLLIVSPSKAGGLKPCTLSKLFLAFTAQLMAVSQDILEFSLILLSTISIHDFARLLCKSLAKSLKLAPQNIENEGGVICTELKDPNLRTHNHVFSKSPLSEGVGVECHSPQDVPTHVMTFHKKAVCLLLRYNDDLLQDLNPRLALSGHTHHGCHVKHRITEDLPNTMHEYTIPSFSWRNKKSPTFTMLTLAPNNYAVYKCHMPQENTVYAMYMIAFILLILWIIRKRLQVGGFVYKNIRYVD